MSREFENMVKTKEILNQDFTHVEKILEQEREKSYAYLKNALQIEDKN